MFYACLNEEYMCAKFFFSYNTLISVSFSLPSSMLFIEIACFILYTSLVSTFTPPVHSLTPPPSAGAYKDTSALGTWYNMKTLWRRTVIRSSENQYNSFTNKVTTNTRNISRGITGILLSHLRTSVMLHWHAISDGIDGMKTIRSPETLIFLTFLPLMPYQLYKWPAASK